MGSRDLKRGDILGTGSTSLLRVPLEALVPHDVRSGVTAVAESPLPSASPSFALNVAPDTSDDSSSELVHRLDNDQRESLLRLWSRIPPRIRRIDFVLVAPGWEPSAIDAHNATLAEYADIFSSSKLDYCACSLRPFEIKVPPGTQPIQSRPYRLNPVLPKQADAILDSYLAAGLI